MFILFLNTSIELIKNQNLYVCSKFKKIILHSFIEYIFAHHFGYLRNDNYDY